MTANVALTDTFDQWRVKSNELIVMTQTDGMSNIIKTLDTTNSTSNTTGSIINAGGVGITKSVTIGENLQVHGNVVVDGDTTISGNLVFGDADSDQVTFTADINSHIIPNANLSLNLFAIAVRNEPIPPDPDKSVDNARVSPAKIVSRTEVSVSR